MNSMKTGLFLGSFLLILTMLLFKSKELIDEANPVLSSTLWTAIWLMTEAIIIAIVFGSNYLKTHDMVSVVIIMNIISIVIIFIMDYFFLPILWNFETIDNHF